ncbi:MAG: prepilin-type N-terminal cleavage/methylation domain-containing protein [Alkaliphilus sp.]
MAKNKLECEMNNVNREESLISKIFTKGNLKKENGFTLVELLIVLTIVGMMMGAVMMFFLNNFRTYNRETDDIYAQTQANKAMAFLTEKIIGSSGNIVITGLATDPTYTFSFERGSPNNDFVAFHFVEATEELTYGIAVSRADAELNATNIVAESISDFYLVYSSGSRVVELRIESTKNSNVINLVSNVSFRN